ncbi:MAG: hypothetical protein WCP55_10650, partial [Lentisphaerota bacterium]
RLDLGAYPGNSNPSNERERWISTTEENINISKDAAKFKPNSNALVMYSKIQHEKSGNFIVFDHSKYSLITSPKSNQGVEIQFVPQKAETEFIFALGYFNDKPAKDETPKFLKETQPKIFEFMDKINWDPKVDSDEFNKLAEDTAKLIKDMDAVAAGKYQQTLDSLKNSFTQAASAGNLTEAVEATDKLKKLQVQISNAGLSLLK